jgi:hypothetical protein
MFMVFQLQRFNYSNEILNAAAAAQGEKSSDTIANAPSSERCGADGLVP